MIDTQITGNPSTGSGNALSNCKRAVVCGRFLSGVEGFPALNLTILKHPPPFLNDSSLVFLTTARIYAKLHDVYHFDCRRVNVNA